MGARHQKVTCSSLSAAGKTARQKNSLTGVVIATRGEVGGGGGREGRGERGERMQVTERERKRKRERERKRDMRKGRTTRKENLE